MEGESRRKDREDAIERQIREAQERGEFDDLPGRGKPLDLTANPFARDQELAYKILKDAGYAPAWIEHDKAIRARLAGARAALVRSRRHRDSRLHRVAGRANGQAEEERARIETEWRRNVSLFLEEIAVINSEISVLNLKVPSPRFQRSKIDAARQVAVVEAGAG